MAARPRILVLGEVQDQLAQLTEEYTDRADLVHVDDPIQGLTLLNHQSFDLIVVNPNHQGLRTRVERLLQSERRCSTHWRTVSPLSI